jgi:hypothetical protein
MGTTASPSVAKQTMCWDHCHKCNRSQSRFWVSSKEQFEKERVETQNKKLVEEGKVARGCAFCGGPLVSYADWDDTVGT